MAFLFLNCSIFHAMEHSKITEFNDERDSKELLALIRENHSLLFGRPDFDVKGMLKHQTLLPPCRKLINRLR